MKISLAELEYNMEKDQIEIMNLSQKIQSAKVQNVKDAALKEIAKQDNLYRHVHKDHTTILIACEFESSDFDNIGFCYEGFGLEIKENNNCTLDLSAGDRIIEVNGRDVLRVMAYQWDEMQSDLIFPCKVVFIRLKESDSELKYKIDKIRLLNIFNLILIILLSKHCC